MWGCDSDWDTANDCCWVGWYIKDSLNTIWAQHLSDELKRRFYKNWYKIKKAFSKYTEKYETDEGKKDLESDLERMKKYATVVCVLAHTFLVLIKSYRV